MLNIFRKRVIVWLMPIMVSMFVSGCGTEGDPILGQPSNPAGYVPKVVAVTPVKDATDVFYDTKHITAQFSVPMDNTTLTPTSFTLFDVNSSSLVTGGTVFYANRVADLAFDANLTQSTVYNATVTTDAKDTNGVALSSDYVWTFTTGSTADTTPPTVFSTSPKDGDLNVTITKTVTATFSESMVSSSITAPGTFTVKETLTPFTEVNGTVSYAVINNTASFNPTLDLAPDMNYTAIITTAAKDLAGKAMAADYNWTFVTAAAPVAPLVNFGLAEPFGIASAAGVTNTDIVTDKTWIDGDVVLNPTATCNSVQTTSGVNGTFGLCDGMAPELTFGHEVITQIYPDTTTADAVRADLRQAYLDITPANMSGGTPIAAPTTMGETGVTMTLGDNYFTTGVYESGTSIFISNDLTLDAEGDPTATFVFQSASTVGTANNTRILLVGGAKASNVYWQVGSSATLGAGTIWNGNILAAASITMQNGTDSCGRLLAGATIDSGAFTFQSNFISVPGNSALLVGCE